MKRKAFSRATVRDTKPTSKVYFRGDVVPKDYVEALKWFRKAAAQGNADAKAALRFMQLKYE